MRTAVGERWNMATRSLMARFRTHRRGTTPDPAGSGLGRPTPAVRPDSEPMRRFPAASRPTTPRAGCPLAVGRLAANSYTLTAYGTDRMLTAARSRAKSSEIVQAHVYKYFFLRPPVRRTMGKDRKFPICTLQPRKLEPQVGAVLADIAGPLIASGAEMASRGQFLLCSTLNAGHPVNANSHETRSPARVRCSRSIVAGMQHMAALPGRVARSDRRFDGIRGDSPRSGALGV